MREFLILVGIGVGSYAMRALFLVTRASDSSGGIARILPHVGPAVIAAITLPALLKPGGSASVAETVPALLAAATSAMLWQRLHSLPIGLFGGLAVWRLTLLAFAWL